MTLNESFLVNMQILEFCLSKAKIEKELEYPFEKGDITTNSQLYNYIIDKNELNLLIEDLCSKCKDFSVEESLNYINSLTVGPTILKEEIESEFTFDNYLSDLGYKVLENAKIQSAKEGLPPSLFGNISVAGRNNVTKLKPYQKTLIRFSDNSIKELYGVPSNWQELEMKYSFLKSIRYIVAEMQEDITQVCIEEFTFQRNSNADNVKDLALAFNNTIIKIHQMGSNDLLINGDKTCVRAIIRLGRKDFFKSNGLQYSSTTLMGSNSDNKGGELDYSSPYSFVVKKLQRIENDSLIPILNSVMKNVINLKYTISNTNNDFLRPAMEVKYSPQVKFEVSSTFPLNVSNVLKKMSEGVNENYIKNIDKVYNDNTMTFVDKTKAIGILVKEQKNTVKPLRLNSSKVKKHIEKQYILLGLKETREWKSAKNSRVLQNKALSSFRKLHEDENKYQLKNPTMVLLIDDIDVFEADSYEDYTEADFNKKVDIYINKFRKQKVSLDLDEQDLINTIKSYFTPITGFKLPVMERDKVD